MEWKNIERRQSARKFLLAMLSILLPLTGVGCKCITIDCQSAPTADLSPRGLAAAAGGNSVHIQASALDIPVTKNVKVCAGYEILSNNVTLEGTALLVFVNKQQALAVEYNNEGGKKVASKIIDSFLVPGKNEVVLVTITYNANIQGQELKTRAGCVILADGKKIVDDCYSVPKAAYEPITKTWTLTTPGGGGGGDNPPACPACHISQLESQWVVGVNPAALGVNASDARAVTEALTRELSPLLGDTGHLERYSSVGRFAVITGVDQGKLQVVRGRGWVRFVEPDFVARTLEIGGPRREPLYGNVTVKVAAGGTTPNDPEFSHQAYLPDIAAPTAWAAGHKNTSVSVAMIDTGSAYMLRELQGHITKGQDFACKHGDEVCDGHGHGTHVSGTILANTDNAVGVAGVAWNGKLLVIRALDDGGSGRFSDICDAVRFAVDQGAKVISMSLGAEIPKNQIPQLMTETAQYALQKGVALVCAAGNDNNDNDGDVRNYPSSLELPNVIGVLATNTGARTKSSFSNFGPGHVHIAAPGTDVLNLWPDGSYRYLSGTSMATPQVSAALAIYWNDLGAGLTVQQRVEKFLATYSVNLPALNNYCKDGRFLQMK